RLLGLDARARPRPPERRRAAACHLRPCRLVRAHADPQGRRRPQGLGDARPRGGAGALCALDRHRGRGAASVGSRGRGRLVQAFAALLDSLSFQPARNAKLRLIETYLRESPDPDRGWALAALTSGLDFPTAKPALLRGFGEDRIG